MSSLNLNAANSHLQTSSMGVSILSRTHIKFIATLVLPVGLPIAYLVYLKRHYAKHTTSTTTVSPPDSLSDSTSAVLPKSILAAPDSHVVGHERVVSNPAVLRPEFRSSGGLLLETFLRTTMAAFSWTPQGLLMRHVMIGKDDDAGARQTFSAGYLAACRFAVGDRVCGVYVVASRTEADGLRVVLDLAPPRGWRGPVVKGCLVVGVERGRERRVDDGDGVEMETVRIVNETFIWRERNERATWIESAVGRWLHGLMVGWMLVRGLNAVTCAEKLQDI